MRSLLQVALAARSIPFRVSRFRFALALLALLLATAWTPAPQTDEIAVVGKVANGTPSGTIPVDLPVTLHVFSRTEETMEETAAYTATLAADGSFRFDGLTPEEGETFVARVIYQDAVYFSDPATLEPGQRELSLPVIVYEVTEDPAVVLITQLHIFLTRAGDRLQVGEYYLVSNTGDRTYVGAEDPETGQRVALPLTLPQGAEGLRFEGAGLGERFLEQEGGFGDTEPIPPGTATVEVSFSYELPYREGQQVERVFHAPVASVVLVPMAEDLALEGAGLTLVDTRDTEMWPALSYAGGPLATGEPLAFTLVARPTEEWGSGGAGEQRSSGAEGRRSKGMGEAAIGLVALAAALVAVYLLWRSPALGAIPARARSLVESVAALDADFEAGRVEEGAYHKKREALGKELRALLKAEEQRSRGTGSRARRRSKGA